jgi:hypothetical protein
LKYSRNISCKKNNHSPIKHIGNGYRTREKTRNVDVALKEDRRSILASVT